MCRTRHLASTALVFFVVGCNRTTETPAVIVPSEPPPARVEAASQPASAPAPASAPVANKLTLVALLKQTSDALAAGDVDLAYEKAAEAETAYPLAQAPQHVRQAIDLVVHQHQDGARAPLPKAPPGVGETWLPAQAIGVGNKVFVAKRAAELFTLPKDKKPLKTISAGTALRVLGENEGWLQVSVGDAAVQAASLPAGAGSQPTSQPASQPASAPVAAALWIEKTLVMASPFSADELHKIAGTEAEAQHFDAAYQALDLSQAMYGEDSVAAKERLMQAAFAAQRYVEAVMFARAQPNQRYLTSVTMEFIEGCRGDREKAELFDITAVPKKLPKNACVNALEWEGCVTCWEASTFKEERKRLKARDKVVERLNKSFPDGPFIRVTLPANARAPLHGFFYSAPMSYQTSCNEGVDAEAKLQQAELSKRITVASEGDPQTLWFEAKSGAVHGFVLAEDEDAARAALKRFHGSRTLEGLAPIPFAHAPQDTCNDCASCGD